MRPLSEATSRIAGKSYERKYIALGRIVNAWAQIVGEEFSTKAQPVKLDYRKRERSKSGEARLDIAVSSADATVLHYQKDLILERINQIFGERWITAIRFVHVPANSAQLKPRKMPVKLSDEDKNIISTVLRGIEDTDIRGRLEKLGQFIMIKGKDES